MDTKQQLINALAGLGSTITEAMDVIEGFVPCGHPALTVSNALGSCNWRCGVGVCSKTNQPIRWRPPLF